MFQTFIFIPLYNFLVFLVGVIPGNFMWIAVFVLTFVVKIFLIPLYKKQIKDQVVLSHVAPKAKALQEKHKENKEVLAKETMALYREHKINPLTSILLLLIQLPILFAIYKIFLDGVDKHLNVLYSFVNKPDFINNFFFGINLAEKSLIIVVLAVASQYLANIFMFAKKPDASAGEFAQSLHVQIKYIFPIMIGIFSYVTPAVISVYIIAGNVFAVIQEILIRRPLEKKVKANLK